MIDYTNQTFELSRSQGRWLRLATIYHILIGLDFLLRPLNLFNLSGLTPPQYAFPIQMMGVAYLVLGLGLVFASQHPYRYALLWVMLWATKVMGILIFGGHILIGNLPLGALIFTTFHDLLWLPFLTSFLWGMFQWDEKKRIQILDLDQAIEQEVLSPYRDQYGNSLAVLNDSQPVLIVFLRHFGCTFCRETMADLARDRKQLETQGVKTVVVHISTPQKADAFFDTYNLGNISRISDPGKELYQIFDLQKATISQAFGWRSWVRGIEAGIWGRHGVGREDNDGWQMPGAFLLYQNIIRKAFRHQYVSDRPDYCEFVPDQEITQPQAAS